MLFSSLVLPKYSHLMLLFHTLPFFAAPVLKFLPFSLFLKHKWYFEICSQSTQSTSQKPSSTDGLYFSQADRPDPLGTGKAHQEFWKQGCFNVGWELFEWENPFVRG